MIKNKYNYGIAGLGLMGTAIAAALRKKCGILQENIFASDSNSNALHAAEEQKLIIKGYNIEETDKMLSICDVVFLCLNPSSVIRFLNQWQNAFKEGSIITDIAGTKSSITLAAQKLREDIDFIPGHPMAGAEKGGFENFHLVDFTGKNYILTPIAKNKPENIEFFKKIIYQMGFNRITEVTPEEHDNKIAFTSQLCHVIASALIDCESDTTITRFGGGSFEDLTRIAMLNVPMWTELFIENKKPLIERINQFSKSLNKIKKLIKSKNNIDLSKTLTIVRNRRTEMNKL